MASRPVGGAGTAFALSLRDVPGWIATAAGFGRVFVASLALLMFPVAGVEVMTAVLVVVFLFEGVLQTSFDLRVGGEIPGLDWLVANGRASIALGAVLLLGRPVAASHLIGIFAGVNVLTSETALPMTARGLPGGRPR